MVVAEGGGGTPTLVRVYRRAVNGCRRPPRSRPTPYAGDERPGRERRGRAGDQRAAAAARTAVSGARRRFATPARVATAPACVRGGVHVALPRFRRRREPLGQSPWGGGGQGRPQGTPG